MESEFLRLEKIVLREQYGRFLNAHDSRRFMHLRFLLDYIHNTTFFKEICKNISTESTQRFSQKVYHIVHGREQMFIPDDYKERSHLAYLVTDGVVKANNVSFLLNAARKYIQDQKEDLEACFITFNELFVEPFVSYLLNQSDQNIAVFALLRRYKHRTEWFNRDRLNDFAIKDDGAKEHRMAGDLYSYLFDNGMEFIIQPTSPSGEVDFLAAQKNSPHKLLLEAKVFDGTGRHRQHVISGVKQIIHYANDYHEPASFLIIFNVCDKSLIFPGAYTPEGLTEMAINNTVVYILVIDICLHEKTASKRPFGETIQFSKEDFI